MSKAKKLTNKYRLEQWATIIQERISYTHRKIYFTRTGRFSRFRSISLFLKSRWRNGKLTEVAIDKRLKLYAKEAHVKCRDVPLNIHAHQFRHAKASYWIEEGLNVLQVFTTCILIYK